MEKLEEGYCLILKIKVVPVDGNDAWIACMSNESMAAAWAAALASAMSLDLDNYWDAASSNVT